MKLLLYGSWTCHFRFVLLLRSICRVFLLASTAFEWANIHFCISLFEVYFRGICPETLQHRKIFRQTSSLFGDCRMLSDLLSISCSSLRHNRVQFVSILPSYKLIRQTNTAHYNPSNINLSLSSTRNIRKNCYFEQQFNRMEWAPNEKPECSEKLKMHLMYYNNI